MDLSMIATTKVDDLTRTRAAGRAVNTHVVQRRRSEQPDYEQMKRLVHDAAAAARALQQDSEPSTNVG